MTPIAGMKNVAGTWCRSRRSRILGTDVVAPYSPTDKGTGSGFARCSNSLSTSNERQTATRAPLGQTFGVSFRPSLAVPTALRICSSVESTVIGFAAAAGCWRDVCAGWALGELQPVMSPITTNGARRYMETPSRVEAEAQASRKQPPPSRSRATRGVQCLEILLASRVRAHAQGDNTPGSFRMKTRMSPMWAVVEMNSNEVGLTGVVRPSSTAV